MRVVADTNVLISALMFGGLPGAFLNFVLVGKLTLVISTPLLDELDEKLRVKFAVPESKALTVQLLLRSTARVVSPNFLLNAVPDDPDDNRILECAVAGDAKFVVSGDRHLLKLRSHAGIRILTVRQFLETTELHAD